MRTNTTKSPSPSALCSLCALCFKRLCWALALGALAASAHAQDLTVKSPPQKGTIVITNAAIHPISAPDIPKGFIIFRDGKIVEVGAGDAPTKQGADVTTIDGSGKHVYPGMIAASTQMGMTEIQSVAATNDTSETGTITPEVHAATAVNPDSTLIPVTRSNGVLVCGVFPQGGTISGQPSVIRMEGWTSADMTIAPSIGLAVRWPNARGFGGFFGDLPSEQPGQPTQMDRNMKIIADAFDAAEAYAKHHDADPTSATDIRWEAMRDVFDNPTGEAMAQKAPRKRVYITANDVDQITSAVSFCVDHHLRCVIVGGRDSGLCADLLKEFDVPVIVMGTHRMPRRDDAPYDEAYTLPARLNDAGVKFAMCTSDDTAHERNLPYQAAMAVAYGLPLEAGLKSVTLWPAEILGIADQIGSLESGKSATLILTSGNPLEVTTKVEKAFIDGRDIDLTNKQTKLADKYRERYRQMGQLKDSSAPEKNGNGGH
jgi:imidazolonepropionase-like amidohydrolase